MEYRCLRVLMAVPISVDVTHWWAHSPMCGSPLGKNGLLAPETLSISVVLFPGMYGPASGAITGKGVEAVPVPMPVGSQRHCRLEINPLIYSKRRNAYDTMVRADASQPSTDWRRE